MKKIFHYGGNIAEAVIALFLYGILQDFYFFPKQIKQRYHLPLSIQEFATALVTVAVIWFIFWMYKKQLQSVNDWGFNERPHWSARRIMIFLAGFILITVLGGIMLQLVSQGKTVSTNQENLDQLSKQSGKLFEIMVCFVAPACEEVIFRGMFFNTFFTKATRFNKWAGILVSGFLFAYMHDPGFTKFIYVYWVLGCVLGWVYMSTKDLRYSILTHMCYNSLGFVHMMTLL